MKVIYYQLPQMTVPSNVQSPSPKKGDSIAEPNLDTTKYHRDEAKMINIVAIQCMQEWCNNNCNYNECECDECVMEHNNRVWEGCNKCRWQWMFKTGATNLMSQTQLWEQWMVDWECANCTLGHGVQMTQIRNGSSREHYAGLITCWKVDEPAQNRPNKCIVGVSKEQ